MERSISSRSVIRATFCRGRGEEKERNRGECPHGIFDVAIAASPWIFHASIAFHPSPPPPPWMSRWCCRITFPRSFLLLLLLLYRIPPMLLGELSVSRICQSEPYSDRLRASIAAFFQDPFHPSSYSLSTLILVNSGSLAGYYWGRREFREEEFWKIWWLTCVCRVESFWLGNARWCTEFSSSGVSLKWLGNGNLFYLRARSRFSSSR